MDLYDDEDGAAPVNIPIVKKKIHENYNPTAHIFDIAILTLENAVDPSKYFLSFDRLWLLKKKKRFYLLEIGRPVCLPLPENLRKNKFVKYQVFIAGWGAIYFRRFFF